MAVIQTRLLADLQVIVQTLNLESALGQTGNVGPSVFVQLLGETLNITTWPAVLLTTEGEREEEQNEGENFEESGVTYPIKVLICDPMRPGYQANRDDYFSWRHSIAQALRDRVNYPLLPNVAECFRLRVRPMPIVPEALKKKVYAICGLIALCDTVEPRLRTP